LKILEAENAELRRAVSELTLDKLIMIEALSEVFFHPLLRRAGVDHARSALGISERRACKF
jgi:putative transposase